jgi:hypothetical protein
MVGKVCALVVLTAALIVPSEGNAQSITDARRAEFTPSTDHNAVDASTGVALLQRYSLEVFLVGGATPVSTADLGKPTPDADGMIRIDFVSRLTRRSRPLSSTRRSSRPSDREAPRPARDPTRFRSAWRVRHQFHPHLKPSRRPAEPAAAPSP